MLKETVFGTEASKYYGFDYMVIEISAFIGNFRDRG